MFICVCSIEHICVYATSVMITVRKRWAASAVRAGRADRSYSCSSAAEPLSRQTPLQTNAHPTGCCLRYSHTARRWRYGYWWRYSWLIVVLPCLDAVKNAKINVLFSNVVPTAQALSCRKYFTFRPNSQITKFRYSAKEPNLLGRLISSTTWKLCWCLILILAYILQISRLAETTHGQC